MPIMFQTIVLLLGRVGFIFLVGVENGFERAIDKNKCNGMMITTIREINGLY